VTGLLIFGAIAGYVAFWSYVLKIARNRATRIVAILIALLIPFWDLPIGYLQFRRLCSAEGGLHVYERITPQDKVYFQSVPSSSIDEMLRAGFKVVEILRADGRGIARHQLEQGRIVSQTVQSPESLVAVSITRNDRLAWNIYRYEHIARSISSNEPIARHTGFTWHGGWLKEASAPLFRGRLSCSSPLSDPLVPLLRSGS
jgi:hypothetical protein